MGTLTGKDIPKLANLLDDTLDFSDLESFVYASTGDQLYSAFVPKDKPKRPMIEELLVKLEKLGTTSDFLAYVYVNRPGRKDVRKLITSYFPEAVEIPEREIDLSAQEGGDPQPEPPKNAITPGFQRNVKPHLPKLDVRVWQEKLVRIERQVCRVELEGKALGTGFLVGPDTVLTNWHVLEAANNAIDKLSCRFDYVRLSDGTIQAGQLIPLAPAGSLETSPYSQAEKTDEPETPLPTADELDYALLRLVTRAGEQQVEGSARGWIVLPKSAPPLPADAPILIVQHPEGGPMKLALDTQAVKGRNGNGTRIRYLTNTDPGSSGSPVFTIDWGIVALHHYGDPNWQKPLFNQGVPIELIRQRIENNQHGNMLGA
jgi:hypothetical protein